MLGLFVNRAAVVAATRTDHLVTFRFSRADGGEVTHRPTVWGSCERLQGRRSLWKGRRVRFYMRTSRRSGVSVGIFGAIVVGFCYLILLILAAVAIAAIFVIGLAVKGVQALANRRRAVEVLSPPSGSENGVQRPTQARYSDRR